MNALLDARAGGHARYLASAQDDFAALSGGLPRQALRLQYEYLVGRERLRLPAPRALGRAARRARDVLLAPPLGGFDSELLRAIRRQGGVRGEPGDEAVLRTWAIITDRAGHDGLVPARLNPLLEEMLGAPREPRDATLGIWERAAAAEGMSPAGVGPGPGQQDTAALVQHLRDVGVMQEPYGVLEAFEALRDVLLPPVGVGLAVVLYEQEEAARIAADAVLGLHAAEEEPPVQHREVSSLTELRGLPWTRLRREGLSLLLLQAAGTGPTYAREAVLTLEAHRNHLLVDVDRCLLWLPVEWAQAFLQHGHHLRPFVSFLMLEQEVLEGVSTEDLRYDLEHLEDRAENGTPEAEARDRLRQVVEELLRREGT